MPFDSLSKDQQDFITKHFKSGTVFSTKKTKSANEQFNDDLQRAVTPIYEQANKISRTIDTLESRGYEHTPFELYRGVLAEIMSEIPKTMKAKMNELKNREVPSFDHIKSQLQQLEDRLAKRIQTIKEGRNVDKATDDDALTHQKETIANKVQIEIDQHQTKALSAIREVKEKTTLAFFEDVKARDKAIAAYHALYEEVSRTMSGYASKEAQDKNVLPEPFRGLCETARNKYFQATDKLLEEMDSLTEKDQVDQSALNEMLSSAKYADLDNVKREKVRMAAIETETEKVANALEMQKEKMESLREEYRNADGAEKKKLQARYEALKGHIQNIEARQVQLETFKKDQVVRERRLVAAADMARLAGERVVGMDSVDLPDEDPDWIDTSKARGNSADTVLQNIEHMRTLVEACAKREMIIPKLSKDEAPVMELSAAEAKSLLIMLKAAENYTNAGRLEMAEALYFEVRELKSQFTSAREAMRLPAPVPPQPSIAKKLIQTLTDLEADANNMWGVGAFGAEEQIAKCQKLRERVKDAEEKGKFIETPNLCEAETEELREAIGNLEEPDSAYRDSFNKKASTATKKADEIAKFLDGALKTAPITEQDIIEVPGTPYEEKQLKYLVRTDEIIMVTLPDGKVEKRKIITKQGRGGEVHGKSEGKKIPVKVLEAMHSRNQALRAMTETGAMGLGAEQMLEDYTNEANAWLEDVQKNGETHYPELAQLITDCDKIFKKGKVAEFIPDDFGTVKAKYDSFKDGYLKKMPSDAKKEGDNIKEWVEALESAAGQIETAYKAHKMVYEGILADLKGKKNKSEDGAAVGKLMQELLSKKPEELFKGASDPDKIAELSKALQQFEWVKKFYAHKKNQSLGLSPKQMDGDWMNKTKTAYKKLDSKVGTNVKEAGEELEQLRNDMKDFNTKMSSLNDVTGADLAARLIELCDMLSKSAESAVDERQASVDYVKKLGELSTALKVTKRNIKALGRNPAALQLKDQLDALEARRKGTKTKMKSDEAYEQGLKELEEIAMDLADLDGQVADVSPGKMVTLNAVRIATRLPALEKFMKGMKDQADQLASKDIRPRMEDMETDKQEEIEPAVVKVDSNLKQVKDVLDLTELKKIGAAIDKALDEAQDKESPKNTKAARVKLREEALKEIRKIRSRLEAHPAVTMYGENPFDGGQRLRLVGTALHHLEVVVLACVDPREAD